MRPNLVDPGVPTGEFAVDPGPKPKRRILTDPGSVDMKAVSRTLGEWKEFAATKSSELLASWSQEEAVALVNQLAKAGFFETQKFGVYRHGGTVGWLSGLVEFPELSKVLVKLVTEIAPKAAFTSVMVSHNSLRSMHKDFTMTRAPTTM